MKRTMFVGRTGCGKTTLIQAIRGKTIIYRKTQAVGFCGAMIDTPGEFAENRRLYPALMASSVPCDIVGLVQDASVARSIFPPGFGSMFNKPVIGVVSKIDRDDADPVRAEKFLRWAGALEIFQTSSVENIGICSVLDYLEGLRPETAARGCVRINNI